MTRLSDLITRRQPIPDVTGGLGYRVGVGIGLFGLLLATIVAALLFAGLWYMVVVMVLVGPAFYVLNRYPFATVMVWLAISPFLMVATGARPIYWLIYRALPLGTLVVLIVARWIGVRTRPLPKLGWPEAMMAAYVVFTIVSIAYRSLDTSATYIYMYDHVVIPMTIYMLVRLVTPGEEDLSRLVPVLGFFVVTQTMVGILGWVAPDMLPAGWLEREERATGTLIHPNVFAVALLFAGLYLTHFGQAMKGSPWAKRLLSLSFPVTVSMAIVTLSRASWLAALVVVAGTFFVYPHLSRRTVAIGVVAAFAIFSVGLLGTAGEAMTSRATSQESALSRLPVVLASLRMIDAKPMIGWGYENFDRYDQTFQGSIEGIYVPDKDHASHNFFLTLGAESGLLGLFLYLGPAVYWLVKSRSGVRNLPEQGFRSKKLVSVLWIAMLAQVVVYNFSNNRVAFGLGVWWLTLGLLATVCDWRDRVAEQAENDLQSLVAGLREPLGSPESA